MARATLYNKGGAPVGDPLTLSACGELAGATSATVCAAATARYVRLKARSDNAGSVYLGFDATVTAANGTTDTTTGFELAAGDDTGWLPLANLNQLWRICNNAGDDLTYWVLT